MILNGNMTRADIESLVDDIVATQTYHKAEAAGCTVTVSSEGIGDDVIPVIKVATNDSGISVRVEAIELTEGDEVVGWEFEVMVGNSGRTFKTYLEDAMTTYKRWAAVAELAEAIAEITIYPEEYFE